MKVAILGAGCYRTHAASGITNFKQLEKKTFQ